MKNLDMLISYVLLSMIGLGIILIGVAAAIIQLELVMIITFIIGILICIAAFFAARNLID